MAEIRLKQDNTHSGIWWLWWAERDEAIGRIVEDASGRCQIVPQGSHWSPMKSYGGISFDTRGDALDEVQRYFSGR